ncbi:MAG: hypothetical protein HKN39_08555 [Flavobacteriales bacterium]|nr:hypothetical protein [Flavobacteriales bacterium]
MIKHKFLSLTLLILLSNTFSAQRQLHHTISWEKDHVLNDGTRLDYFQGATYDYEGSNLPELQFYVSIPQGVTEFEVAISDLKYEDEGPHNRGAFGKQELKDVLIPETSVVYDKGKAMGLVKMLPYVNSNGIQKVSSFSYEVLNSKKG